IALDQHVVRLRDAKGLGYIAALLRRPRTRIHSADLTGHNPMPRPEAISSERLDESAQRATPSADPERLKVTQRIKATLRKIAQSDTLLGDHLGKSIRTGLFCRYDPQDPVSWDVS